MKELKNQIQNNMPNGIQLDIQKSILNLQKSAKWKLAN